MKHLRLSILAIQVGVIAGLSSALFLWLLELATTTQRDAPWLLWLLPLAGLAVGVINHRSEPATNLGTSAVLAQAQSSTAALPLLLAPTVLLTTLITHLFGGSAGREGTAVQMSAGLSDPLIAGPLDLDPRQRSALLRVAVAGGFGAVFGVPFAGAVFGLEVMRHRSRTRGRSKASAWTSTFVPALIASFIGDRIVLTIGIDHLALPRVAVPNWSTTFVIMLVLAAVIFAITAASFTWFARLTSRLFQFFVPSVILRPVIGGGVVVALALWLDTRDYLGLSLPLITNSLTVGVGVASGAFIAKMMFTTITLGSGFRGGEVTPLFVIGATLGAAFGQTIDLSPPAFAALGMLAVFAGAARTPIACTVMAFELFGSELVIPAAIVCIIGYRVINHRGIYQSK
jgi:H+/Cl- antiporter ClcA